MPSEIKSPLLNRYALFDLAVRVALGVGFAFVAGVCLRGGIGDLRGVDAAPSFAHQIGQSLSSFSIGLYSLMIACLYALRLRPTNKFAGVAPSAAAILGGFLMFALVLLNPREDLPLGARVVASVLVVVGNLGAAFVLTRLGRSFSILPEGRRLVTTGPYAIVRHPLYVVEAVATVGVVMNFWSIWAVLLGAAQLALQIVRIHYEEKVLRETFPEYAVYAEKTWRLVPGVY